MLKIRTIHTFISDVSGSKGMYSKYHSNTKEKLITTISQDTNPYILIYFLLKEPLEIGRGGITSL